MEGRDVVELLQALEEVGIDVFVEGGWGVDALVGQELRPHKDVDLVVRRSDVEGLYAALQARGFQLVAGALPDGFVCKDPRGRAVDVRGVVFAADGRAVYERADNVEGSYSPDAFAGQGTISDVAVRCLTPVAQMQAHTGYEQRDIDVIEVGTLHDRFGIPVPEEYAHAERPQP
jgi:lincosamide nucleotidyltransferase A/C/D/E